MAETKRKTPTPKGLCQSCKVRRKLNGPGHKFCAWCWLERQAIETQVIAAQRRLEKAMAVEGWKHTKIVPKDQWEPGTRWCSGCQSMIPLRYVPEGKTRCRACEWKASRDREVQVKYEITTEEYWKLWNWQGGRCYMCGRRAIQRALAVDHDHTTGKVRGLLCAHQDWGCNVAVMGNITGLVMAHRIVAYLTKYPIDRMRDGEKPPDLEIKNPNDYLEPAPF